MQGHLRTGHELPVKFHHSVYWNLTLRHLRERLIIVYILLFLNLLQSLEIINYQLLNYPFSFLHPEDFYRVD